MLSFWHLKNNVDHSQKFSLRSTRHLSNSLQALITPMQIIYSSPQKLCVWSQWQLTAAALYQTHYRASNLGAGAKPRQGSRLRRTSAPAVLAHIYTSGTRQGLVVPARSTEPRPRKKELLILKRINTLEEKQMPSSRLMLLERHFDYKLRFYHLGVTCPANTHPLICLWNPWETTNRF